MPHNPNLFAVCLIISLALRSFLLKIELLGYEGLLTIATLLTSGGKLILILSAG